jgi:tetratricopeptide (TPR) repeat protein
MAGQRRVPEAQSADPVAAALARALVADPPDPSQVREQRLAEVKECLAAGRSVEAALALCELGLEIAIPPEALGPTMRRAADAHVGTLMNAICQAETVRGEAARPLLATFASFRQAAGRRAHVLNTFESLCHVVLGEPEQAIERLLAALAVNPFLVGAYKDLGDLFMRAYEMRRAWTCWEAARRFSPQHKMLTQIAELEKTLATEHPEFF